MFKIKLTEDARYGVIFVATLLLLLLFMIIINFLLGGNKDDAIIEKQKEKTVVITQPKQNAAPPQLSSKAVVSTVREAIKKDDASTAYIEINKVPKGSPEYEQLSKIIADENRKRKAPGVRKEAGQSPGAPIRYLDESTPRDRMTDAVFVYFVDVSSTMLPHFCIQSATKKPLKISGYTITADSKILKITAPVVKLENTEKGVSEWYDIPLDRPSYDIVQAIIKAKKTTLTITGSGGSSSRPVTDAEKTALRRILDGYIALGGNLDYLQTVKPAPARPAAKHPAR